MTLTLYQFCRFPWFPTLGHEIAKCIKLTLFSWIYFFRSTLHKTNCPVYVWSDLGCDVLCKCYLRPGIELSSRMLKVTCSISHDFPRVGCDRSFFFFNVSLQIREDVVPRFFLFALRGLFSLSKSTSRSTRCALVSHLFLIRRPPPQQACGNARCLTTKPHELFKLLLSTTLSLKMESLPPFLSIGHSWHFSPRLLLLPISNIHLEQQTRYKVPGRTTFVQIFSNKYFFIWRSNRSKIDWITVSRTWFVITKKLHRSAIDF